MGNFQGKLSNEICLDMRIDVALTLLHTPNSNILLNNHLTSFHPLQSKFCKEFPTHHEEYANDPVTNSSFCQV